MWIIIYIYFIFQSYVLLKMNTDFDNIHISRIWSSQYSADVARFVWVCIQNNQT